MNRTLEHGRIDGNGSTSDAVYSFLCDEGYMQHRWRNLVLLMEWQHSCMFKG